MVKVRDVEGFLKEIAPYNLKLDFDNIGLLLGTPENTVKSVIVALDITEEVISEALERGADLIVSHHPIIFEGIKSIVDTDPVGHKIIELLNHNISTICLHTNLDAASGGVNDVLAGKLGASVVCTMSEENNISRVGELPEPVAFKDYLRITAAALGNNGLRYHDAGRPVKRIGISGGAGGHDVKNAFRAGCDTFITADIKYHQFLMAKELGLNLIDADHFCTENVIVPVLAQKISDKFPSLCVIVSAKHKQPIQFYVPD